MEHNQHDRLIEGATQAVEERGFAKVTVADIVRHAAVSRRTFYKHFTNKEECIEAAFGSSLESGAVQEMKQRLGVPSLSSPPTSSEDLSQVSKLPRGRHGLSPEFVESNQRERLIAGAIKAVEERGLTKVRVADIARHAMMSKADFYRHFDSKEECIEAAFGSLPESERVPKKKQRLDAPAPPRPSSGSKDRPASSRSPRGRQALSQEFIESSNRERLIAGAIKAAEERGLAKVKVADILRHAKAAGATFYKHFTGKEECMEAAFGSSWDSELARQNEQRLEHLGVPDRISAASGPRGDQRERLIEGATQAVEERGFAKVTVADIVRHAALSPRTFYNHFTGKRECMEAAFGSSWTERVRQDKRRLGAPDRTSAASGSRGDQRERLIEGAIKAVEERGLGKVRIADITRHAKMSNQTFYQHFSNKKECIEAAFGESVFPGKQGENLNGEGGIRTHEAG